ncbi:PfkB family carbohydrate kinase [Coriobacterium glomerans]|nr:PfkB family carbohydrate kinase [Coriobacterium glomerans]
MYPGGNAANFAVYAKRCGAARAAYMGIFGNDIAGEHVISSLCAEGIECVACKQMIGENGAASVTVVDGDRIFLGSNEGGIRGDARFVLDRFDLEYIRQFDVVHTGSYCFTERELPKIRKVGVPVSFDFSDDSASDYIRDVAPLVDFAFLSLPEDMQDDEVRTRLEALQALGPRFASATRGAAGCIAFDGRTFYTQRAKSVSELKDSMGAGDSFLTAFLMSFLDAEKRGITQKEAITDALDSSAAFAATICGMEGSWGHGKSYE